VGTQQKRAWGSLQGPALPNRFPTIIPPIVILEEAESCPSAALPTKGPVRLVDCPHPPQIWFQPLGKGTNSAVPSRTGALLLGGLIFQAACAGESRPGSQTYTVTITGTSESTQHFTTTTLTVQ